MTTNGNGAISTVTTVAMTSVLVVNSVGKCPKGGENINVIALGIGLGLGVPVAIAVLWAVVRIFTVPSNSKGREQQPESREDAKEQNGR